PGVLLAVVLSLLWLLWLGSRAPDPGVGRVAGMAELHHIQLNPPARTISRLFIFPLDPNLGFYNCDYFKERGRHHIPQDAEPVEWVVIDASPVNVIDYTALQKLGELHRELLERGIVMSHAHAKSSLGRFFRHGVPPDRERATGQVFETLDAAIAAFEQRQK